MGCASSKIDDLPAVALCRERLGYLDQALHQRYAFAEAHVAYIHSLKSVGVSLHHFSAPSSAAAPPSPRKGDAAPSAAAVEAPGPVSGHLSHSNSGSHLQFNSDSDNDDRHHHDGDDSGSDGSLHHHDESHLSTFPYHYYEGPGGFNPYTVVGGSSSDAGGYMHMNYMRKQVTPSVSCPQKPLSAETVQFGESSSSYNYPAHPFYSPNQMPINHGYMNYGTGDGAGFFRASGGPGPAVVASSSKPIPQPPPPPPPPPPSTSTWDFLNLFESIENNYPPYTPSRDSREVREEEGIPDLEDEHNEHEVVKEIHGNQKLVDENTRGGGDGDVKIDSKRVEDDNVGPSDSDTSLHRGRSSASPENNPVEYEVHMVDKKVVDEEGQGKSQQHAKGHKAGFRNVFEVVREIQVQFERASATGSEVEKVLEVGKLRYLQKKGAYQVSFKMLNAITPSLPSKDFEASLNPDEDVQLRSVNLSASMQKLYLWEKKLFEEVKAEEKMRVLHDRKLQKWKRLDERGAEAHKIESTRSVVGDLSTKIRIAIQIVDKISMRINEVRDEELWPQLNELIEGLSRMWRAMLECHYSQCQAIDGAMGLDAIAFPKNTSDTQLEATLQLEHDLINWTCRFTEWVGAQKGFVRTLNSWLLSCLIREPEVTADGVAPFSPGRAGAPPVFVICNQWNQSLERVSETSEKEVVDSMRIFAMMVWHFRERDKGEMRQRMTANKDMERKVKDLEREDMKMQKEIQALDKKMVLSSGGEDGLSLSGHVVYQIETSSKTSLLAGLVRIFEAMDRFTGDSVKVYEELLQRTQEVVQEHGKVP